MHLPSIICSTEPEYDPPSGVFISLGSNQSFGELSSCALITNAIDILDAGGDTVIATSSYWKSDAWPAGAGAPDFINAVCWVKPYDDDPALLLSRLHQIEAKFGRVRDPLNRWSSRTLDLDLIDYNGLITENNSSVMLPHPRIEARDFVLYPLTEVCSNWVHPITLKSAAILLKELERNNLNNNCIQITL